MEESVSDSEVDHFNSSLDLPKRGTRRWNIAVRRSSIGWSPYNGPNTQVENETVIQPERIIDLLRSPSVQIYTTLKRRLLKAKSNPEWILRFLHNDGLEILFESLEQLCQQKSSNFLDGVLQVGCIECVKTVMDNSLGLDYIVENKDFTLKFAKALDTDNVSVKKQIFELLSALCVYSKDGYCRALDALDNYRVAKKQKYRFSLIIDELRRDENVQYKIVLLEFINCILIYTEKIGDRIRVRNEFYGLKLQELINQLRRQDDTDQSILVQLDVFEEHKANDDEQLPGAKGVDLNSPLDVFHAIFRQISETPQEINFLTSLQHMLKVDPNDANIEIIWQTIEQLVCKATLVESAEDSQKLLMSTTRKREKSTDGICANCKCHERVTSPRRGANSVALPGLASTTEGTHSKRVPAPPPPTGGPPPPPPPPPPPAIGGPPAPPPPPPPGGVPGAPPPPPAFGSGIVTPNKVQIKLPQQNVPKPKNKMRSLQWQKIPANKVMSGKPNVWSTAGKRFNGYMDNMDFEKIEELFALNQPQHTSSGEKVVGSNSKELKKKESSEVNLLEGKRSLNVNIFLKQFRMPNEEIIQLLRDGNSQKFGAERLKGLLKILPYTDEVEMFRAFTGDKEKLGTAEKFFICLMGLPYYKIRIEGLLLKEEFTTNMEWIQPSLDAILQAAKDLKESKELHELLYLVLIAGNYLNMGNYAGDAAGFKLSSLIKLTEIRANKTRMNMLHFIVMQAEEKNPKLLNFPTEMKFLKDASLAPMESLSTDITNLANRLQNISTQMTPVGNDFKQLMEEFLKMANADIVELQEDLKDMESLRLELSDFFCEDASVFRLDECFKILQLFCERFQKAITENETRKKQEEKAAARQKKKEAEIKQKSDDLKAPEDLNMDHGGDGEEGSIVDMLLADVRSGFANRKFGESNFSVKKVQKVSLDGNDNIQKEKDSFVRGGYGRRSLRNKKSVNVDSDNFDSESTCSSLEDANDNSMNKRLGLSTKDDNLMNILISADTKATEPQFERYGSLRRRRQQRREERGALVDADRERAQSPSIELLKTNERVRSKTPTYDRPKSDEFDHENPARPVRRARSMVDRTTNNKNGEKDTEDILNRVRRKLQDKKGTNSPETVQQTTEMNNVENNSDSTKSSRWRSGINLQTIDEKRKLITPTRELLEKPDDVEGKDNVNNSLERSREKMARRFSGNTIDPSQIKNLLDKCDSVKDALLPDERDTDFNQNVSVSVKTQLNRRWHSDLGDAGTIDKVLKDIEDSEKRGRAVNRSHSYAESTTASMRADDSSPNGETEALKHRRSKRKERSHVSLHDVHAALKSAKSLDDISAETNSNDTEIISSDMNKPVVTTVTATMQHAPKSPKSPKVPPRMSLGESPEHSPDKENKSKKDPSNMSKAAKLAAKRRFRHERFGDKEKSILDNPDGRWKSDVQREEVDQALKDMAKSGMSRSKSYDESVARKAAEENGDFSVDNTNEHSDRKSFRGSVGRLGSDGRRNGLYFPNSDSDSEVPPDGTSSPKRSSSYKSDSPKSSSRLSIKSTSTSTETLRCETPYSDLEGSDHTRKNSSQDMLDSSDSSKRSSINSDYNSIEPVPPPRQRRPKSVYDIPEDEQSSDLFADDSSPMALMSKWKQNRRDPSKRRQSYYDNVQDQDAPSSPRSNASDNHSNVNSGIVRINPQTGLPINHRSEGSGDSFRNDIGSRCSYASSSDSARDEGFETMSGTISQRTSMSSTLESEITHSFGRKPEPKYTVEDKTFIPDEIITPPPKQEITVAKAQKLSELDARKRRTESWTEAVVASTTSLNKDSSLDSSMDYSATSPDSGHGTSKEDVWSENIDMANTIKNIPSISTPETPRTGAPLAVPEAVDIAPNKQKRATPSYMKGTSSSSSRTSVGRPGSAGSDSTKKTPTRGTVRNSKSTNLNRTIADSNTSLVSNTSTTDLNYHSSNKSNPKLKSTSALHTSNSRSTTPHPPSSSRSTTPHPPSSSRSTTPHPTSSRSTTPHLTSQPNTLHGKSSRSSMSSPSPTKPFSRTQSLRMPNTASPTPSTEKKRTSSIGISESPPNTANKAPRRSFMSPTASSKARIDGATSPVPPTPPPRTTSTGASPLSRPTTPLSRPTTPQSRPSTLKSKTRAPQPPITKAKDDSSVKLTTENVPDVSPLRRHGSLRLPSKNASGAPIDSKERVRAFMNKIGGNKVKPDTNDSASGRKLATVQEQTGENQGAEDAKSSSFIKRIVGKTKDKTSPKKSTDLKKAETPDKKKSIKK